MTTNSKVLPVVYNAMFSVVSLILAFLGSFSIFPVFPFLKADISDVPVLIATLIFGIPSGTTVLITVSLLRALLFSTSGWIGFIIRLTTAVLVVTLGIAKKSTGFFQKTLVTVLGICICLTLKLSLNYFFWINFFSISRETINSLLLTIILPYNIIKVIVTLILAIILSKYLDKYLKNNKI